MMAAATVYRPIVEPLKHIHAIPAFITLFSYSRLLQSPTKLVSAFYSTPKIPFSSLPSFESTPVASFLLHECGFSLDEANNICRRKPDLLAKKSYDNSRQTLHFLRDKGFNEISVHKIFLRSSFQGITKSKVEFLERIGFTGQKMHHVLTGYPYLFSRTLEKLVGIAKDVEGMGIEKGSKAFAQAFLYLSKMSKDTVKVKLKNLRELGFTEEETGILVKRYPRLLGSSTDKVRQNLKFLDEEWKLPRNAIMGHPAALSYSIEKRLKPRLNALRDFMKMNKSLEKAMSYPCSVSYISMSDKDFHRKVVSRLPGE